MSEFYVLRDKTPVRVNTIEEWAKDFEARERHVGLDDIGDIRISTVFLGINHSWGSGPPLLFETMIFGGDHYQEQWRYSTYEEAESGHKAAVNLVSCTTHPR